MKRFIFILSSLLVLSLVSCTKEVITKNEPATGTYGHKSSTTGDGSTSNGTVTEPEITDPKNDPDIKRKK